MARASLESGAFTFHYIIDNDVCYLTLVDKSYPKKLAFQYLEELQREFYSLYGHDIEKATRPYAFIKFGMLVICIVLSAFTLILLLCLHPAASYQPLTICQVQAVRPCSCASLLADTFIQKTKKLYLDTRTQRNMAKLTEDISEVHSIMTKNIQDVLNHGERLDRKIQGSCGGVSTALMSSAAA